MDFPRRTPAVADRSRHRATIATRIATRENTLVAGEAPAFVHPEKTGSVHQGAEPRRVDLLADARNDHVRLQNALGPLECHPRLATVRACQFAQADHLDPHHPRTAQQQALQRGMRMQHDALLDSLDQFARHHVQHIIGCRFRTGQAGSSHEVHFFGSMTLHDPCDVHRGIAAPVDHHPPRRRDLAHIYPFLEQIEPVATRRRHHALHVPWPGALAARCQEYRRMVLRQFVKADMAAERLTRAQLDTQRKDPFEFRIENRTRQAGHGDRGAHQPAGFRQGIEYHRCQAPAAQMIGSRNAGRTRADDRHPRRIRCQYRDSGVLPSCRQCGIAQVALEVVNTDGLVVVAAVTATLAGMRADPAGDGRHRVDAHQFAPGAVIVAILHACDPCLGILAGRTGDMTGRRRVHMHRPLLAPASGPVAERGSGFGPGAAAHFFHVRVGVAGAHDTTPPRHTVSAPSASAGSACSAARP